MVPTPYHAQERQICRFIARRVIGYQRAVIEKSPEDCRIPVQYAKACPRGVRTGRRASVGMTMPQTAPIPPASRANGRPMPPRSGRARLATFDGRTREARFIATLRADLILHVGGSPSVTEAELIDMACDTAFEIEAMKRRRAERDATLSLHDHKAFLAYQNTLRRTLAQLGMKGAAERPRTLAEHLAAAAASRASAAPATSPAPAPAMPPSTPQQAAAA